jgi:hypothetical protein
MEISGTRARVGAVLVSRQNWDGDDRRAHREDRREEETRLRRSRTSGKSATGNARSRWQTTLGYRKGRALAKPIH